MNQTTIDSIHTSCKDCVFATYDGITQNSCALHYIDKYKEKGVEIIEAYDNDKEFFIINKKKCVGYRENKWFKQFDLEDSSLEVKIDKYKSTNLLDYLLVVNLKNYTLNQLDNLCNQIESCYIKPKKLILVRYIDNSLSFSYDKIEKIFQKYNISYAWRVQTMLDNSMPYEESLHNITIINSKYRFIVSISEPNSELAKIVEETNKIVHEDLGQFDVISNKHKTLIVYSGAVYRFGVVHKNNILKYKDSYQII